MPAKAIRAALDLESSSDSAETLQLSPSQTSCKTNNVNDGRIGFVIFLQKHMMLNLIAGEA